MLFRSCRAVIKIIDNLRRLNLRLFLHQNNWDAACEAKTFGLEIFIIHLVDGLPLNLVIAKETCSFDGVIVLLSAILYQVAKDD